MAKAFLPVFGRSPKRVGRGYTSDTGGNACATAILAIAIAATSAIAQTTPATTKAATRPRGDFRTLDVSPVATPTPALKYQLRPDFTEQIDGNAALHYLQAIAMLPDERFLDSIEAIDESATDDADFVRRMEAAYGVSPGPATRPAANPPGGNTRDDIKRVQPPLLETATLRTGCDWEYPARFEGIRTLLPNLNEMRGMANWLRSKFRYAVATGDYDAALHLLRTATVLADRTDDGQTFLVNELVSVGIEAQCMEMHARLIVRPDAPNLYWALRRLPVPFGNLKNALEAERAALLLEFPALRRAGAGDDLTADDWRQFTRQLIGYADAIKSSQYKAAPSLATDAAAGAIAMLSYVNAKAYYVRTRHVTDEQAKHVDPLKVSAIYAFETYRQASDALYKWFALPYPQMLPGVAAADRELQRLKASQPANLFLTIAPSLGRIGITNAKLDRTIAAITVVEAIRAYAADHDGALPATLDAIVDTPPPMNPVTGRPFDYSVDGDVATIADDGKLVDWPLRYEVRLRK